MRSSGDKGGDRVTIQLPAFSGFCYQPHRSGATMAAKQKTKGIKEAEMEERREREDVF